MRFRYRRRACGWASVAIFVALVAPCGISADDPAALVRRGTVIGRVVDWEGRPVEKARIVLQENRISTLAEGRTSADGKFVLTNVPARLDNELWVQADGFGLEYRAHVPVFAEAKSKLADFVVAPGREVIGRVFDIDGKPKANVEFQRGYRRHLSGYCVGQFGPTLSLQTDSEGRYRIRGVPPSLLNVFAEFPERVVLSRGDYVVPGSGPMQLDDIKLIADTPVAGTVKDADGRPLAGIKVETNLSGNHDAVTDADGRFELRGIGVDDKFRMWVDAPGFAYVEQVADSSEPPEKRQFILRPCVHLGGRVVDSKTGEPVRYQDMALCVADMDADGKIVKRSCRRIEGEQTVPGQFRLSCNDTENYSLTVSAIGYREHSVFIDRETRRQNPDNFVVKLERTGYVVDQGHRIAGVIREGNTPIRGAWVSLCCPAREADLDIGGMQRGRTVPTGNFYATESFVSSEDGSYSLTVPHSGKWFVAVDEPSGRRTIAGPIEIKRNEDRRLDIAAVPCGTISGRVQEIPPQWSGYLWVVAFDRTTHHAEARVQLDGTFRLENPPPGEYGLKVGHDGYSDPEVPRGIKDWNELTKAISQPAHPWKAAVVVQVASSAVRDQVELVCPKPVESKTKQP